MTLFLATYVSYVGFRTFSFVAVIGTVRSSIATSLRLNTPSITEELIGLTVISCKVEQNKLAHSWSFLKLTSLVVKRIFSVTHKSTTKSLTD